MLIRRALPTLLVAYLAGTSYGQTMKNPKCPCVGTNYQVDDGNGKIPTLQYGLYDATYGESCKVHAEPGRSVCTASSPASWCSLLWCYIDPCFCTSADIGESDYFATPTASGKRIFYSYEACGSLDAFSAAKCPPLLKTACTAAANDECAWSESANACTVATGRLATARAAGGCSTLIMSTWGSQCMCMGSNKQERVDDNGTAVVMVNKASIDPKKYAADYGGTCKIHQEPGNEDCQSYNKSWCFLTWCYVDPCRCNGPTDFGLSDYFTSTIDSKPLYYSYNACGSSDQYASAKCAAFTASAACTAEDECAYSAGACGADASRVSAPRNASGCGETTGATSCPCINSNGQTPVNGKLITDKPGFKDHQYPIDYGKQCTPHAEPGQPGCQGNYPQGWCSNPFCYVDPCNCNDPLIGLSDYFTRTTSGKPLYYSYATCGNSDGYNTLKCPAITTSNLCNADDECTWSGGACGVSTINRLPAAMCAYKCSAATNCDQFTTTPAPAPSPSPSSSPSSSPSPSPSPSSSPSPSPSSSGGTVVGTVNCPSVGSVSTSTVKFGDMNQGAEFTQCISICDFNSKTLADSVTTAERLEGGCCPEGFIPGARSYASYQGAQVVCGFKPDGTVAISTGSSGGSKTCTYNKCYVHKQNLLCADGGGSQLINGCCGQTKGSRTFPSTCLNYDYTLNNAYNQKYEYCLSYDVDYGTKGWSGTAEATDDQANGALQVDKLYTYTPCAGGGGGGGGTSQQASLAVQTAVGAFGIIGVLVTTLM